MSVRIFSAAHEGAQGNAIPRFYEKKTGTESVWVLGLFPFSEEKASDVMLRLQGIVEKHIGSSCSREECFENILKEANDVLPIVLGEHAEELLRQGALLLGFLREDELFLSNFGQGEVFLHRGDSLIEISEGLSPTDSSSEIFQNISNGDIQGGDRIIFSTYRLQRFMTERQLAAVVNDGVTEVIEEIRMMLDPTESGTVFLVHFKSDSVFATAATQAPVPQVSSAFSFDWKKSVPNFSVIYASLVGRLKGKTPDLQKNYVFLGILGFLGVVLLFLFFVLLSGEEDRQTNAEYTQFIEEVETRFNNVDQRFADGRVDEANVILNQIEETANEMRQKRVNVPKAEQILEYVQKKREYVNNIMRITNPEVMTDFMPLKENIVTRGFFPRESEIVTFDDSSLYRTLISGISAEGLGIISSEDPLVLGTDFSAKDRAIFLTKGGRVLEWDGSQSITVDTADETWKSAVDIQTFSKFLYFLDPTSQQIWKYERRDSGFTLPEPWVNAGGESLANGVSFAIDGSVFVLTSEGEIIKYYRGEIAPFELSGLPKEGLSGDILYTNENLDRLFILDKEAASIFIFSKYETGAMYERKIVLEDAGTLVDMYVSGTRLFVLSEKRLFDIPLGGTQ